MIEKTKKDWVEDVLAPVVLWLFIAAAFFVLIDYGLAIWIRIGIAVYVTSGIYFTLTPKSRKILASKKAVAWGSLVVSIGLIVAIATLWSKSYFSDVLVILTIFTITFSLSLIFQRVFAPPYK